MTYLANTGSLKNVNHALPAFSAARLAARIGHLATRFMAAALLQLATLPIAIGAAFAMAYLILGQPSRMENDPADPSNF